MGEFDTVRLLVDLPPDPSRASLLYPEDGLAAGALGAIIETFDDGRAFMVEFVTDEGEVVGIVNLDASQIELVHSDPSREPKAAGAATA